MSGEWIEWRGGSCPVETEDVGVVRFADGSCSNPGNIAGCYWDWRFGGKAGDIVAYKVGAASEQSERSTEPQRSAIISDGGSSGYYKLTIKNKAGEEFSCEMGDIIRSVVDNDFDLGNILKASRRMSLAKQGKGKAGTTVTYDANKIKYFAEEFAFWHEVF